MTTFERPDAGLLVEDFLPTLLGANHSLTQELVDRDLFFCELSTTLENLRGRLTIISSPARDVRVDAQYPWLWRYVNHFTVGAQSYAIQHSKLWAFHWVVGDQELLELHVSSTNLTSSAFKNQVQAGWQIILPLDKLSSHNKQRSWGEFIPFLEALGASAGDAVETRIRRLITLLGRVECPQNTTFIASIPGGKSAARQLQRFNPSKLHLMTPTIGEWNERTLKAWGKDAGVASLDKIHIKWISESHSWTETKGWSLSTKTKNNLLTCGVDLECLSPEKRFTEQHRDADARWSHAKLYLLKNGRKRCLLVTSANWSVAAWGAGNASPRNFEVGVVFETDWKELEAMGRSFKKEEVPFCIDNAEDEVGVSSLVWAEAKWTGQKIELNARSTDFSTKINAFITFSGGLNEHVSLVSGAAVLKWDDPKQTPITASFAQAAEVVEVDVLDLRCASEFAMTPLPEINPDIAAALRERFLLQRYGGSVVDAEFTLGQDGYRVTSNVGLPAVNYSVQEWIDAREAFNVVDRWCAAVEEAKTDASLFDQVRLDGEELQKLYERRDGPAAKLVAEELELRLGNEA